MDYRDPARRADWGAIVLAVVTGLGVTLLMVALGIAIGALAVGEADQQVVSAVVGGWVVFSALVGAFAGTFIGGRFSATYPIGSAVYHGMGAWALTAVVTVWLGVTGVVGTLGAALGTVTAQLDPIGEQPAPVELPGVPTEMIGWGGWALFLGLLLALGASILGWIAGARTRPAEFDTDRRRRLEAEAEAPVRRERAETRP